MAIDKENKVNTNSIDLWNKYGSNVFVVQPFMDSVIVSGEGCFLIDADGNRILDMAAGQFCSILGYRHARFNDSLKLQLEKILHIGDQYVSDGVLQAASRLAELAPGRLNKVLFLSTGSEANECALRIAKAATKRTGVLGFSRGYYGISLATRNLGGIAEQAGKIDSQPAPPGQFKLLTPVCHRCPIRLRHPECSGACIDVSVEMIHPHLSNISAIIVETVLSAGGMIFPPKDVMNKLFSLAKDLGALMIVDEAQTGFGRCGKWFDIENHDLEPDILVLSKTAGNGFPVAALVISDSLANKLESEGFSHLSSHQNDPLGVAAVQAVMDIVRDEDLIGNSIRTGGYFLDKLNALRRNHSLVCDVRGRGLMIGMELAEDPLNSDRAFHLALLCEQRGLHITFTYFEPVIRFIPPLIISEKEVDTCVDILDEALTVLEKKNYDIKKCVPKNERSGPYVKCLGNKLTPSRVLKKMWETSPRQWMEKIKK